MGKILNGWFLPLYKSLSWWPITTLEFHVGLFFSSFSIFVIAAGVCVCVYFDQGLDEVCPSAHEKKRLALNGTERVHLCQPIKQ
jgi:hypothetical protein